MENETPAVAENQQKSSDVEVAPIKPLPSTSKQTDVATSSRSIPGKDLIYKQDMSTPSSLPATIPKGKIFYLVPKLVYSDKTPSLKNREPRFIPFEPYKAAVNPIIPYKKTAPKIKINRNNLDLNVLVSQMSDLKTSEMRGLNEVLDFKKDAEREKFLAEIKQLKQERNYFENELKFQSQVNSELKKLLVAAVGEDIQTKVNVLTEDKLQLARALLDTAQNLSSHSVPFHL